MFGLVYFRKIIVYFCWVLKRTFEFFFSKLILTKHLLNNVENLSWSVKVAFTVVVIAVHLLCMVLDKPIKVEGKITKKHLPFVLMR